MKRSATIILAIILVFTATHLASTNPVTKKRYTLNSIQFTPQIIDGKQYVAKKTNPLLPVIDGRLDDPVWKDG